ncbi:MAG: hypothetical protein JO286_26805 [Solirubrobacterales bacterium]|nr:hypothetical protein [Solirubrobacterales bacterium]MBV9810811.1 hypothetical protein [Solirubrobacterales bacterium]
MRRLLPTIAVAAVCLFGAPTALATTQTAHGGTVTATFTFEGKVPNFRGLHLTISRAGAVVYNQPVVAKFCGKLCWPGPLVGRRSAVQVVDLEHTGDPDIVLNLYSGGAHCCTLVQIFSFDAAANTYVKTERVFGDPDARIVNLRHDGRFEFLTADDAFAYRFTDYAASGLPIEILTYANGRFTDVTRSYPRLVAKDAAVWLKAFNGMARAGYPDSVGVIAAWAADEDLLGHSKLVTRYLAHQARAGHLNAPVGAGGAKFVAQLQKFLRRRGYLR